MDTKLEIGFMRHKVDNPEESQRMVDYAMQHGQPYFETCYFYLNNKCEQFIYSLLTKYSRESYRLCGKLPVHGIAEQYGVEKIFQEQISRVPGGYFDTYLLQALDSRAMIILKEKGIIPYLLEQKRLGKIKQFGISIQCDPETFKQYLDLKCWDIVQMPLNYYDWFCCRADELYKLAKDYNLPIIAQAPMKGGLLKQIQVNNPTEFALDFVANLDVEYILTGASHVNSYIDTYNIIKKESREPIDFELYKTKLQEYLSTTKINCVKCNRCTRVCPTHIPTSALIALYNKSIDLDNSERVIYFNSLNLLKKSMNEPSHVCNGCLDCLKVCPLKNNLPDIFHKKIFEMRT